jgi:hypothetical protein
VATKKKRVSGARTPEVELLTKAIIERWKGSLLALSVERVGAEFADASRYDVVAALRALEHAGEGTFAPVRGGKKPVFVWKGTATKQRVGKRSSLERPRKVTQSASAPTSERAGSAARGEQRATVLEHDFHLRSGFVVKVALPTDLTAVEAERLCRFLQALPFESSDES